MEHRALIEALGGPGAVAAIVGVDPTTPYNWTERGIPARHWLQLVRAARRRGIKIDIDAVAAAAPQYPHRPHSA